LDIELKTADPATAGYGTRWKNIVKEHSKLLKDMHTPDSGGRGSTIRHAGYTLLETYVGAHSRYWLDRCLRQSSREVLDSLLPLGIQSSESVFPLPAIVAAVTVACRERHTSIT
jgi:hypothetical protein